MNVLIHNANPTGKGLVSKKIEREKILFPLAVTIQNDNFV